MIRVPGRHTCAAGKRRAGVPRTAPAPIRPYGSRKCRSSFLFQALFLESPAYRPAGCRTAPFSGYDPREIEPVCLLMVRSVAVLVLRRSLDLHIPV